MGMIKTARRSGLAPAAATAGGMLLLTVNAASAADAANGKKIFEVCTGCHSETARAVGPTLRGVYGRMSGSVPDYKYSAAMKRSKIVWDDQNLHDYIVNPQGKVKASNMSFRGVRNDKDIGDLVEFLKDYK